MNVYEELLTINPDLFEKYILLIQESQNNNQWFQLGFYILKIFEIEESKGFRQQLFETSIKPFIKFLDKKHITYILVDISQEITNPMLAIKFLKSQIDLLQNFPNGENVVKLNISIYLIKIAKYEESLQILKEVEKTFNDQTPMDVRRTYYRAQSTLDKSMGDYELFYQHALLFLSSSYETLKTDYDLAYDIATSALFSNSTFSLGEIANHDILSSLSGSENEWLRDLILLIDCGQKGSLSHFETFFSQKILENPTYAPFINLVRLKVKLGMLYELIFQKPFNNREILFNQIMKYCDIQKNEIDLLLMKAFSSNLATGIIDGINEKVYISWVKPKALSIEKLKHIKDQIDHWKEIISIKRQAIQEAAAPIVN